MGNRNAVLLSGYAKLPSNITAEAVYSVLNVTVLVDKNSGVILEAEATMVTELAKKFVAEMLVGYDLNAGPDGLTELFEEYYLGSAKKAIVTAVRMIFSRYQEYLSSRNER